MRENSFSDFVSSFMNSIQFLSNQTELYMNGADTFVGRKRDGDLCAVNLRLLYRIAMRESFMNALEYFLSDQFISDAYDIEEVGIKLLPLTNVTALAA